MTHLKCSGRYCRTIEVSVGRVRGALGYSYNCGGEYMRAQAWSSSLAPIGLPSEPGPLLDETAFDFALDRWYSNGGRFSLSFVDCTLCGADFALPRALEDSPPTCGGMRVNFVLLFRDEGPDAATACGMTDGDSVISSLSATRGLELSGTFLLKIIPIAGRRKHLVYVQAGGLTRTFLGIPYRRRDMRVPASRM